MSRVTATEKGMSNILLEISQQYSPIHGIKEYVTNAIDAIFRGGDYGVVKVNLCPSQHRIVIQDDGVGISREKLFALPRMVGESDKIARINERGEKGVGLLSYACAGHQMHLISRLSGAEPYSAVRYYIKGDGLHWDPVEIKSDKDMSLLGGSFRKGTQVVLDIDENIFNQKFRSETLKSEIRDIYWPLLEKNNISFIFGMERNGQIVESEISPPKTRGEELLNKKIDFIASKDGKPVTYSLFVHLWLDPESTTPGKIGVYSKGVRVYRSLLDLDEESISSLPTWNCRQLEGYIEEPDLKLTLGRDKSKAQRNSNIYRGLVAVLSSLDKDLWSTIQDRIKTMKVSQESSFVQEIHKVLCSSWNNLGQLYVKSRTERTRERIPWGVSDPRSKDEKKPKDGPGTKKFPFGQPELCTFPIGERDYRSKLEMKLGKPVVLINMDHEGYDVVREAPKSFEAAEYIIRVMSSPMAIWETSYAQEQSGGILYSSPNEQINEVVRRADDLAFSSLHLLKGRKIVKS